MREAVDFLLSYIERFGDSTFSEKAKQHRFLLSQVAADPQLKLVAEPHKPEPDATGHPEGN